MHLHSFLRGGFQLLALVTAALAATPLAAQTVDAQLDDEVEVEIEVEADAEPVAPTAPSAPAVAPSASASAPSTPAVEPSAPAVEPNAPAPAQVAEPGAPSAAATSAQVSSAEVAAAATVEAKGGTSSDVPSAHVPSTESSLPRSLLAEGSNYIRPARLGLRWWGFIQADYVNNQVSEDQLDPDGSPLNENEFGVRRGRLRIDHGWEYAFATLEIDVGTFGGGPNVRMRRAEASVLYRAGVSDDVAPPFVLTAGVTDVPFGAELGESQRDRLFVERSLGSVALFPSQVDAGIKLWGRYRFFNYALGLVNGESENASLIPRDTNTRKDIVGRLGVHTQPTEVTIVTGGVSFYVGEGFAPGTLATKDQIIWYDFDNDGVVDQGEVSGVTGSNALPSQNFDRWALGLDAGATFKHALGVTQVRAEAVHASNLDRGVLRHDPITTGASSRQLGLTASVVQQITEWGALGVRLAYYDPNSNVVEQRAAVYHLKDESYFVVSPVAALLFPYGRLAVQYDIVGDHLGRDRRGVPTDVDNNQLTVRLQADL